jgi:hypothetical protein
MVRADDPPRLGQRGGNPLGERCPGEGVDAARAVARHLRPAGIVPPGSVCACTRRSRSAWPPKVELRDHPMTAMCAWARPAGLANPACQRGRTRSAKSGHRLRSRLRVVIDQSRGGDCRPPTVRGPRGITDTTVVAGQHLPGRIAVTTGHVESEAPSGHPAWAAWARSRGSGRIPRCGSHSDRARKGARRSSRGNGT